jgi:hypothetical protein
MLDDVCFYGAWLWCWLAEAGWPSLVANWEDEWFVW